MDNKESKKWSGQQLALFVFEAAMAVFYLVFAVVFLFPSLLHVQFTLQFAGFEKIRIALGIILGIYGIFRVYRAIRKLC